MSKEQLDRIKSEAIHKSLLVNPPINVVEIKSDDFNYLCEQASCVEDLTQDVIYLEQRKHKYANAIKCYREALEEIAEETGTPYANTAQRALKKGGEILWED